MQLFSQSSVTVALFDNAVLKLLWPYATSKRSQVGRKFKTFAGAVIANVFHTSVPIQEVQTSARNSMAILQLN